MFSPSSATTTASQVAPSPRSRTRTRTKSAALVAGDVTTLFSSSSPLLLSIGFAPPSPSRYSTSTYTAHYTNNNTHANSNNVDATSSRKIRSTTVVATAGESPQIHLTPTFSSGFSPRIGGPANGGASPRYRRAGGSVGGFGGGGGGGSGLGLGVFGSSGTAWEKQQQQLPSTDEQPYELQPHRPSHHHHPLAQTVLTYNDPDLLASSSSSTSNSSLSSVLTTTSSSSQAAAAFEDEYEHHPLHTQALHHPLSISYLGRKHARTNTATLRSNQSGARETHLLSSPTFKSAPKFITNRAFDAIVFLLFWICFVVFLSALLGVGGAPPSGGGQTRHEVGGLIGMMPVKATSWSGASLSRELVTGVGQQEEVVFGGRGGEKGGGMVGLGGGAMRRVEQQQSRAGARVREEKRADGGRRKIFFGKFPVGPRAYGWEGARG